MSELDFSPTRIQLMQLYNQGDYVSALYLLEREAARFPQQSIMYHWQMCLAARADEPTKAMAAFREALAQGYGYPVSLLREDEDLHSLQGTPEFEELVAVSLERYAAAETSVKPELLVVPPEGEAAMSPAPLLIGLHGNSQNARVAADDWRDLHQRGWMLALPQSGELLTSDAYMWNDFSRDATDVMELCHNLLQDRSIDPERVILGGFSAGGGLAIQLAVSGGIAARGFLVVGPYLRDFEALTPYLDSARANGVRGYVIMGLQENATGLELIPKTVAFLQEHGIPCELEEHSNLGHAFPPDFAASLDKALTFLLPS